MQEVLLAALMRSSRVHCVQWRDLGPLSDNALASNLETIGLGLGHQSLIKEGHAALQTKISLKKNFHMPTRSAVSCTFACFLPLSGSV